MINRICWLLCVGLTIIAIGKASLDVYWNDRVPQEEFTRDSVTVTYTK